MNNMPKIILCFLIVFQFGFSQNKNWKLKKLEEKSEAHLDSTKWNKTLFNQDRDTYSEFKVNFEDLPLQLSAFPVADYDYSVATSPFEINIDSSYYKGIHIGNYKDETSDDIVFGLTFIFKSPEKENKENSFIQSRNFPYLAAQGTFRVFDSKYDWVFASSPDGFSFLLINMKLFDLRFGKTILILPNEDGSFYYKQYKTDRNLFKDNMLFSESFKKHLE
jgi:hypothetical protein